MQEIVTRVTTEIGHCCVCGKRLKGLEHYYDLNGLWVHVKCFQNWQPSYKEAVS